MTPLELKGGFTRAVQLPDPNATYLVAASLDGIGVELKIQNGEQVVRTAFPDRLRGKPLVVLEQPSSPLNLELRPTTPSRSGRVHLTIVKLPVRSTADRTRVEAFKELQSALTIDGPSRSCQLASARRAATLFHRLGMPLEEASALHAASRISYLWFMDWEQGARLALRARDAYRLAGAPLEEAWSVTNAGMAMIEGRKGVDAEKVRRLRAEAQGFFQEAAEVQREKGALADLAWTLNNAGIGHFYEKNYPEASRFYHQAQQLAAKEHVEEVYLLAMRNAALVHGLTGDVMGSIDQLERSIALLDENPALVVVKGHTLIELGNAQLDAGQWARAINSLSTALELPLPSSDRARAVMRLVDAYLAAGDTGQARLMADLAMSLRSGADAEAARGIEMRMARVIAAENRYDEAIQVVRSLVEASPTDCEKAGYHALIASYHRLAGRMQAAREAAGRSLQMCEPPKEPLRAIRLLLQVARLELETTDPDLAMAQSRVAWASQLLDEYPSPDLAIELDYVQARLHHVLGDIESALNHAQQANARLRELGNNYALFEYQAGLFDAWKHVPNLLVSLQLARIERRGDTAPEAIDPAVVRALHTADSQLALADQQRSTADPQRLDRISQLAVRVASPSIKLEQRNRLSLELEAELRKRAASLATSGEQSRLIDTNDADLLPKLEPGTAVWFYWLQSDNAGLWIIDSSGVTFHALDFSSVDRALDGLTDLSPDSTTAPRTLNQLSSLLIHPFAEQLVDFDRLVIVGTGNLGRIPFAALSNPDGVFLSDMTSLAMAPSLTRLAPQPARITRNRSVAIIADPRFSSTDERFVGLPFSGEEALDIAELFPAGRATLLTGSSASRRAAMETLAAAPGIFHFATHTRRHPSLPSAFGLALAEVDSRGEPIEDSLLTLADLDGLDYPAELVVLSGCETGAGPGYALDGARAFSTAFLEAGSRAVLVSLWPVADQPTAVLMESFYRQALDGGHTLAESLSIAQRQVRQNPRWRHPYYWAGWILYEQAPDDSLLMTMGDEE